MNRERHFTKGIDISHHQGIIDWEKVKESTAENLAVDFCYFKCTEGAIIKDRLTPNNAIQAKKKGIYIGYYHFAFPQNIENDAKNEAEYFISVLKNLPEPTLSFPYVLDLEVNPDNLSSTDYYKWIKLFILVFQRFSSIPLVIYGSPNFLDSNLPSNHKLGIHPLWIAHYKTPIPRVPVGWSKWKIWQYTDKGIVDGVNTSVDLNYKLLN